MVSKDIIEQILTKSIEGTIGKCSNIRIGKLSVGNNVKKELSAFREKTKDLKYETMEIITTNGEVVVNKDGEKDRVDFADVDISKLGNQGYYDLIIEHNHPGAYADSLGNDVIFSNKMISTILSDGDVMQLWHSGTAYIEATNDVLNVTPFKGIVAECPNGSRMSLIRKDGMEDVVLGQDRGKNMVKFEKTYDILHNKWKHYMEDYDTQLKFHMKHWVEEKDISKPNWTSEDYHKEQLRFSKKFNRNHFNENYLGDVIKDFDELGFDLSVEWIYD